jgi:2-dehydropantoate 2-reductase
LKKNIKNPDRVFAGVAYLGSTRLNNFSVSIGAISRTVIDAKATVIAKVLRESTFEFESTNEITQAVWDKMVINTTLNALGAITNLTLIEMGSSKECLKIINNLLQEFEQVAKAEGVSFTYLLQDKLKDNWQMPHHPSMWYDLQNKKRTEIDAINGAISSLGKKHSIKTPFNDMITSLIKIIEVA